MSRIVFDRVNRTFQRGGESFEALHDVSFEVAEKEFVAIVGPSGCGKTTLLRMAAGLEFPTSGSVRVANRDVTEPGPDRAVVFQQFALFPWKSVDENIGFGLKCRGVKDSERAKIVA
ncbi:MAG TPA: ATP-binding cassette domain-containing protein, partial [Burkholderiales bacterium]|nr:ATP-binding cassette domain-containing protein [Burkholderiales bacterium]